MEKGAKIAKIVGGISMIEIGIISTLALVFGSILIFLNAKLNVKDRKKEEIEKRLPGYNCGACGFGSCMGMVEAILKDKESYLKCRPMRKEAKEEMREYLENEKF